MARLTQWEGCLRYTRPYKWAFNLLKFCFRHFLSFCYEEIVAIYPMEGLAYLYRYQSPWWSFGKRVNSIGGRARGQGGTAAVDPPPPPPPPPELKFDRAQPSTFWCKGRALELKKTGKRGQQFHLVHDAVKTALPKVGQVTVYKYKNYLQSSQQNSCHQNATRRGPQTGKITFHITYGICNFRMHISVLPFED